MADASLAVAACSGDRDLPPGLLGTRSDNEKVQDPSPPGLGSTRTERRRLQRQRHKAWLLQQAQSLQQQGVVTRYTFLDVAEEMKESDDARAWSEPDCHRQHCQHWDISSSVDAEEEEEASEIDEFIATAISHEGRYMFKLQVYAFAAPIIAASVVESSGNGDRPMSSSFATSMSTIPASSSRDLLPSVAGQTSSCTQHLHAEGTVAHVLEDKALTIFASPLTIARANAVKTLALEMMLNAASDLLQEECEECEEFVADVMLVAFGVGLAADDSEEWRQKLFDEAHPDERDLTNSFEYLSRLWATHHNQRSQCLRCCLVCGCSSEYVAFTEPMSCHQCQVPGRRLWWCELCRLPACLAHTSAR